MHGVWPLSGAAGDPSKPKVGELPAADKPCIAAKTMFLHKLNMVTVSGEPHGTYETDTAGSFL